MKVEKKKSAGRQLDLGEVFTSNLSPFFFCPRTASTQRRAYPSNPTVPQPFNAGLSARVVDVPKPGGSYAHTRSTRPSWTSCRMRLENFRSMKNNIARPALGMTNAGHSVRLLRI